MGAIFLSYSRDDQACADALAHVLGSAGHDVWWDRRIESGEEFSSEIEAALERADIVLVGWSAHSSRSPWVRDEATVGRESGRLLPVSVDGSRPPIGFRQYQTLDLKGWKGGSHDHRTAELLDSVERRLKHLGTPEASRPLGERRLWGFSRRRLLMWGAAGAFLLIIAAAAALLIPRLQTQAEPASLAVLPFENMSAGNSYFAEGVAEEISNQLSREPQFKVTGRTSASLFKGAADLHDVGRRLHVAYVLEGSVRSQGKQVRVDVSLVETRKGVRLWSQDFEGSLNDMFAIQDSIGQQVAAHVRRQLIGQSVASTMRTSGDVYALYVTARSLMREREPGKLDAAVQLLKRAVKLDPNYAPAWARLGLAEQLDDFYANQVETGASRAQRIGYVEHAIALAPNLADAHAILGLFLTNALNARQRQRARAELETAVKLDGGNAEAWYWLATLRADNLEFDGALDALRRTASIDPFFVHSQHLPPLAWEMGHRDEALRTLDNVIDNNPDPYAREIARSDEATLRFDLAGQFQHGRAARDLAPPDLKDVAENRMGAALLAAGLFDQAEQYVPKPLVDLRRGKLTFSKGLRDEFPSAERFWQFSADDEHLVTRVLLKLGQSRDLVEFYDEAFSSPEDMAARYAPSAFVMNAPLLAIALHQAGRGREGAQIVVLADNMCRAPAASADVPTSLLVKCSRIAALMGRKEDAIEMLQHAVGRGWHPSDGEYPAQSDEPAYAALRGDPRLSRIDAALAAERDQQRHRLLASGT